MAQVSLDLVGEFDTNDLYSLREALDRQWGSKEMACVDLCGVTSWTLDVPESLRSAQISAVAT